MLGSAETVASLEILDSGGSWLVVESLGSAGGLEAISLQSRSNLAQISKKVYRSIGFPEKKR